MRRLLNLYRQALDRLQGLALTLDFQLWTAWRAYRECTCGWRRCRCRNPSVRFFLDVLARLRNWRPYR